MRLPRELAPQLATLVDAVPRTGTWSYEMKFDGYRLLARCTRSEVRLFTRNGHDWTRKLPALRDALLLLAPRQSWIDGELVALGPDGLPNFQQLQGAFESRETSALRYFAFDLPFHDGQDLRGLPLALRRDRLRELLGDAPEAPLAFSAAFDEPPRHLLSSACKLRLEGLIGKRVDSLYASGRSRDWIKLKCRARQEFVIAGFSAAKGSRAGFGALLLGVHEGGRLKYAGRVGTGFDSLQLDALHRKLVAMRLSRPSLDNPPQGMAARDVTWVSPRLVAEVEFAQWTQAGLLRHAVFRGLRHDKPARAITRESAL